MLSVNNISLYREGYEKLTIDNISLYIEPQLLANPNISFIYKQAFLGVSGKFYIQNPTAPKRYAVYNSIDAYDNRLHLPEYIDYEIAMTDFETELNIDMNELRIVHIP